MVKSITLANNTSSSTSHRGDGLVTSHHPLALGDSLPTLTKKALRGQSIHDEEWDIFTLAKARMAKDHFCPRFVGKLTGHTFEPSDEECSVAFEGVGTCSMIHRGRTGIGMRCSTNGSYFPAGEVVLKRSILPVRYRFEMDEALVVCMLQLLHHFGVLETVMLIFNYLQCNSSVVQEFMHKHADAGERGRLGIPNTSTFLILELVQSPQRRRLFTDALLFELVYTLLSAYTIVRITICDLWARHLHMQLVTYPRLYDVGNVSCLLPSNTYSLRLIDLSNHRHRRFDRVDQLLHASNYHLMFSRDMDNGAKLSTAARALYDWTRGTEFGQLSPEVSLIELVNHMQSSGQCLPHKGRIPSRLFPFPKHVASPWWGACPGAVGSFWPA
eukprot:GGOE01020426.1.p1 GENE.GGOE01020426.1~~GGOE01020426.1.p1  ORF type:complete len:385 (-),score=70.22 GGOE01020426.1:84-1238(-)